MPLSHSALLLPLANIFGSIFLVFGINACIRPASALIPFALPYPTNAADAHIIDVLMVVYGVRDIFIGLAIYIASLWGSRTAVGWMTLAMGVVAVADGVICKVMVGDGEWNHWGYSPMVVGVGAVLVGVFDGREKGKSA